MQYVLWPTVGPSQRTVAPRAVVSSKVFQISYSSAKAYYTYTLLAKRASKGNYKVYIGITLLNITIYLLTLYPCTVSSISILIPTAFLVLTFLQIASKASKRKRPLTKKGSEY